MEKTENFALIKPDVADFYNINEFNQNMDTIDETLKAIEEPIYTEPTTLSNLTSGEKLTVAMGKIAKGIASLITHLADTVSHVTSTEKDKWNKAIYPDNVDTALSDSSENPVQNKVVKTAIDNHVNDKNNPHGVTAEQAGALPSTGGTLSGNMRMSHNNPSIIMDCVENERIAVFAATTNGIPAMINKKDASNYAIMFLNDCNLQDLLTITATVDGTSKSYKVLTTKNKPTGTYIGNGDATTRAIDIGGIGELLVLNSNGYTTLVSRSGAISWQYNNQTAFKTYIRDEIRITNGVLYISSTSTAFNANGLSIEYEVL